ncbi:DUF2249 domain-containing protein [Occultella glacieicola]|uniref:DUF2249 domain-containing protein n=1 Tax=Occultella glacieicola TaxID=2518684 RepID=A0ABY2DXM1_9MICO|nr:DUF2249 domain-containing protein [Occultella glacieicola]TDE88768.1 DUF2249 domain-containing protein [Occultella glacieicola]
MTTLVVATTQADANAVEEIRARHAELGSALRARTDALFAAAGGDPAAAQSARREVQEFTATVVLPHLTRLAAGALARAGEHDRTRLLAQTLTAQQGGIVGAAQSLAHAPDPIAGVAAAGALTALTTAHLADVDDHLLPALAALPGVSLAEVAHALTTPTTHVTHAPDLGSAVGTGAADPGPALATDTPDPGPALATDTPDPGPALGTDTPDPTPAVEHGARHACACGGTEAPEPELDARAVPHAIRHATIFGALDAVRPGGSMILVAPHDPLPLLAQLEQRQPGAFAVTYVEQGPQAWRLRFMRN